MQYKQPLPTPDIGPYLIFTIIGPIRRVGSRPILNGVWYVFFSLYDVLFSQCIVRILNNNREQ